MILISLRLSCRISSKNWKKTVAKKFLQKNIEKYLEIAMKWSKIAYFLKILEIFLS